MTKDDLDQIQGLLEANNELLRKEIRTNNELFRADIKAAVDPLHERIDTLGATLRDEIKQLDSSLTAKIEEAQQDTIDVASNSGFSPTRVQRRCLA